MKTALAAISVFAGVAVGGLIGAAPAYADPPPAPCGSPDVPCAGPGPLTPEQQCAFIAWRTWMPCNWLGMQVPAGTPGSLD